MSTGMVATATAVCCIIWANDAEHAAQQAERENVALRKRLGVIADA